MKRNPTSIALVGGRRQAGFTLLELIVVVAILGLFMGIAMPRYSSILAQLRCADDARRLAMTLGTVRSEAIRLKSNVRFTFSSTGYSWDFFIDGVTDGSVTLGRRSSWAAATPAPITFNGLGLTRGIAASTTITVKNGNASVPLTLNSNGFISM